MTCTLLFSVHRRNSMSDDDDDHMSDRDMGAPSPGGMSSIGGGSRPGNVRIVGKIILKVVYHQSICIHRLEIPEFGEVHFYAARITSDY